MAETRTAACPRCGERDPHIFYGEEGQISYVRCWACGAIGPRLSNPSGVATQNIEQTVQLWNQWCGAGGRTWDEMPEVQR